MYLTCRQATRDQRQLYSRLAGKLTGHSAVQTSSQESPDSFATGQLSMSHTTPIRCNQIQPLVQELQAGLKGTRRCASVIVNTYVLQ